MLVPKFVDRVEELKVLEVMLVEGSYLPLYLYGPEGCGKTRLLREFVDRARHRDDCVVVYIDALEQNDIYRALYTHPVRDIVDDLLRELADYLRIPMGTLLAKFLDRVLSAISRKLCLDGKHVAMVVDDVVPAIGIDKVEWYVKWLYEVSQRLVEELNLSSLAVIVTTSEGESLERVLRHSYASTALIWNLDRASFEELAKQFDPPNQSVVDRVWRYVGGNPRKLIEIATRYRWNVDAWLDDLVRRLRPVVEEVLRLGMVRHLTDVVLDPDALPEKPIELYRVLQRNNLVIYKWIKTMGGREVEPDPELGIGRYYAWQVPAYRNALMKLLEKSSTS